MSLKKFLHENSLSIVALLLFLACVIGQVFTGLATYNDDAVLHGQPTLTLLAYLGSGSFIEALFENWESEFLQMALFVMLTKALRQKGSSESKGLDGPEEVDEDPREAASRPGVPWPVRKGGAALTVYEHSLSIALFALFVLSFALHAYGGMRQYDEEQASHGISQSVGVLGYIATAKFWQESFQNWQSEFLSVAVLVLLTIFLRERGSPQSKAVADPHAKTGEG